MWAAGRHDAADRAAAHESEMLRALWREARMGSGDFDAFVEFHGKFKAFQERQRQQQQQGQREGSPPRKRGRGGAGLRLPAQFDGRHRINVSLRLDERRLGERSARQRDGEWARQDNAVQALQQAKLALEHFIDFQQKKRFRQIAQVARDRARLPIAEFHASIVSAVRENQVVVLAGDTGCGKSTQVPQFLLHCVSTAPTHSIFVLPPPSLCRSTLSTRCAGRAATARW